MKISYNASPFILLHHSLLISLFPFLAYFPYLLICNVDDVDVDDVDVDDVDFDDDNDVDDVDDDNSDD